VTLIGATTLMEKGRTPNKGGKRIDEVGSGGTTCSRDAMGVVVLSESSNEWRLLESGAQQIGHGLNAVEVVHQPGMTRMKKTSDAGMAQPEEKAAQGIKHEIEHGDIAHELD
jgi:hypothetical protein